MKKGMIKFSVMYQNGEGKIIDAEYYTNTHMAMICELLGDALKGTTVEKGISVGANDSGAAFAIMGNMYFDTIEDFQIAFGPHTETIMDDLPNFTNIEPIIQISEVLI